MKIKSTFIKTILLLTISFTFGGLTAQTTTLENVPENETVYRVVGNMPVFIGCEEIEDRDEKRDCSGKKLLEFVKENLIYPTEAIKNKTQGTVIIQYIVKKDGNVSDISIHRDLKDGCGQAAVELIKSMNNNGVSWIPGSKNKNTFDEAEFVHVKQLLPVKFKLPKEKK